MRIHVGGKQVTIPSEHFPLTPPRPSQYANHWIPTVPLENMAKTDYDVLVVGTGAGGGSLVWRLCEKWINNGKRIGVIESGELLLPTHIFNIPTFNVDDVSTIWLNPKYVKRILKACPSSGTETVPVEFSIPNVFGGKTLHWGACTPRMHPVDISRFPVSLREMDQYYNIAEEVMYVNRFLAEGSSLQKTMLHRMRDNGFPNVVAAPRAVDLQPTENGRIHSNVFFSSIIFLAAAMNRHPVDLAVQSRVVKVIVEKGRVAGIQVLSKDKKTYILKAKNIVLSAGTLETPRLLLHSGIGGEAVGHYLTNHSRLDATGIVNRKEFSEHLGILDLLVPRTENRSFQMQIDWMNLYQYKKRPFQEKIKINYIPSGMVKSRFENRITLDPIRKDEFGVPEICIHFSYSEQDIHVIQQMAESIKHAAAAMKVPLVMENGRPKITLRRPGGENHETGTCRMGEDPAVSAVNPFGQIHGIPGLYVADNSVIPTSGAANPTLTTVALACRTADYIVEQLR